MLCVEFLALGESLAVGAFEFNPKVRIQLCQCYMVAVLSASLNAFRSWLGCLVCCTAYT